MSLFKDPDAPMTRADRAELARVVRMRAKVARNGIETRKAELLADFENQFAEEYDFDDARWAAITETATRAVKEADEAVAAVCREVGIPENFRPSLSVSWYSRGTNAIARRHAELRKVAETRLDAMGKQAKLSIDHTELDACTDLAAGALQTDAARDWLDRLPTVERLMPRLDLHQIETGRSGGEGKLTIKEESALPRWGKP